MPHSLQQTTRNVPQFITNYTECPTVYNKLHGMPHRLQQTTRIHFPEDGKFYFQVKISLCIKLREDWSRTARPRDFIPFKTFVLTSYIHNKYKNA
jgi:hypothetical protein